MGALDHVSTDARQHEREFLSWYAMRGRQQFKWLSLLTLFTLLAFLPLDREPTVFWPRAVGSVLLAPTVAFLWLTSPASYVRWWERLATINIMFLAGSCFAILSKPVSPMLLVISAMALMLAPLGAGFAAGLRGGATASVGLVTFAGGMIQLASQPIVDGKSLAGIGLLLFAACGGATVASFQLQRALRAEFTSARLLERERARSEELLRNVLPAEIVERLKATPGTIAERFAEATVLFADIVGFTPLTQKLPAEGVVAVLDELFSAFDDNAGKYGLEKIKTIGDAYMVVGGVPTPRSDHAHAVASMALEMRDVVALHAPEGVTLRLRIGIDSGPVVAGVIGKRKFLYDLWGDTVNTASRMESHGVEDAVHVTEAAYERLRDRFELESRGLIFVKGKGEMPTYLLLGPRAPA